jgi:transposase
MRFTPECRAAAVDLVLESGRTNADMARSLGIGPMTLGSWVKRARESEAAKGRLLSGEERAELEQLRKENARLRMEAEFAKKVAAWFEKDEK